MQVYFLTRGHKTWVDQWITELQGKYLPFNYNGEKGMLQVIVRPIQLWEVAFPAEHRDVMLQTIFAGQKDLGTHQADWKGNLALSMLRRSLHAEKIGDWDATKGFLPMTRQGMSVMGIGEQADKVNYHPITRIPNEGV